MRYSFWQILKQGVTGNRGWRPMWRRPEPQLAYDVVIVGGGGHGLATAYYLAKVYGISKVAVLEKSWLGGGNVGRNTTIVRANYLLPENEAFYRLSLNLWEGLGRELNYNVMVSQRGVMNVFHSDAQRDAAARRGNAMRLAGSDARLVDGDQLRRLCPFLDFAQARFPLHGALWHRKGGTVRHDAVAWGYARGADAYGVDIIENCAVTGFSRRNGRCCGVETTRGLLAADKVMVCVAGSSGQVLGLAGCRLPIETHILQACVSEALKPILPGVITFGAGHMYISQSDKGGLVFGGDLDGYNSYARRGNLSLIEDVAGCCVSLLPALGRARVLRTWGGSVDMSMDGSPFIDKTEVPGLYFNGGWCYGGFKATPASGLASAHLLATDSYHPQATAFRLNRFTLGRMIDEKGQGAQPNHH